MTTVRRALAILTVTTAVVACGGDDGGGDADAADTPVGRALTAELMAESDDSPIATEEDARCVAGGIVSGIGEERLEELGVTAETAEGSDMADFDFTEEELGTVVDAIFDCVDIQAALAAEFEADFGAEGAQCLAENLDEELIRDLFAMSFAGGDGEMPEEFFQAFLDIAAACDLPLNG